MSGGLDDSLTATAIELIQEFGKDVSYTNRVYSDPSDNQTAEGDLSSSSTSTVYDAVISPPEPFDSDMIDGNTVRFGDTNAFIQGQELSFSPNISDSLIIDGFIFTIIGFSPLYSGNLIAAYNLHLRSIGGV